MKKAAIGWMILLLVAFAVSFCAAETRPETFTRGDWDCIALEDGSAEIVRYTGRDAEIPIPVELGGKKVTSIGDWAFLGCDTPVSVTVPDRVTRIGSGAFSGCESLASVTLPESLISIGDGAFDRCKSLTSVALPECVREIGTNPFSFCGKLSEIRVSPDHPYLFVYGGALYSRPDLRLVCFPAALEATGYAIPQGVQIIGEKAFCGCDLLTAVAIPDSVTTIGDRAFSACSDLASVTIPDSVTEIGANAFSWCGSLYVTAGRDSYARRYCEENQVRTR